MRRPTVFYERVCQTLGARVTGGAATIRRLGGPLDTQTLQRLVAVGLLTGREAARLQNLPDSATVPDMLGVLEPSESGSVAEWSWAPIEDDHTMPEAVPKLAADASVDDDSWDWDQTYTAFSVAEAQPQPFVDGPRFVFGEQIGDGRFYTLHRGRDRLLGRDLFLYRRRIGGALSANGFVHAARRLARLQHPNIQPVYELGVDEGTPFFASAAVRDGTLAGLLRRLATGERDIPQPRLLETVLDVARAMTFAHRRGTVHRDLRPKHVRLGRFGEVLVGGWFRARRQNELITERGLNPVDSGLGYLSPERLESGLDACTAASDVWALGALLYAALARRAPLVGRSSTEVLDSLKVHGLTQITHLATVPGTLASLCSRALEVDVAQRTLTAQEFADELEDFLEGTRAEARRMDAVDAQLERAHDAARRHASARARLRAARVAAAEARDPAVPERSAPLRARAEMLRLDAERWFFEAEAEFDETLALLPGYEPARHGLAVVYRRALEDASYGWARLPVDPLRARLRGLAGPEFEAWDRRPATVTLRSDPPGAEVVLHRLDDVEGVRIPADGQRLGNTPLALEGLAPGPYLIRLRFEGSEVVRTSLDLRSGDTLNLRLPAERPPAGFVRVPEGPCWVGAIGDDAVTGHALPYGRAHLPGFVIGRDLVTFGDYQPFLQSLWAVDPSLAAAYAPRAYRDVGPAWQPEVDGYQLPFNTLGGHMLTARHPVLGVSLKAVEAYLAWRGEEDGRHYALPSELQWAKAARGGDGRAYPWGDRPEPTFCHHLAGKPSPELVGSNNRDVSIYGVRDTAGTAREYTMSAGGTPVLRGGGWLTPFADSHLAVRTALTPQTPLIGVGFRLVIASDLPAERPGFAAYPEQGDPPPPEPFEPADATNIGLLEQDLTIGGRTVLVDDESQPDGSTHQSLIEFDTGAGRYAIREEIARGSMGRVMLAWDEVLQRSVALKILHDRHREDLLARYRFTMEARITGRLQHPAIIPIYDLGVLPGGQRFFAMKPVEGLSLGDVLKGKAAGDRRIAADFGRDRLMTVLRRVCQGTAYAHAHGVVHRDLKPANVLIGELGEVLLVDLGLARQLEGDPSDKVDVPESALLAKDDGRVTRLGSVIGTPYYMSPEQAMGLQELVGPLSDVYGLGALLYHTLALRPPFTGRKVNEVLRKVRKGNPTPPSRAAADQDVPEALDMICMRALSMEPDGRQPSAGALADELAAWQDQARIEQRNRGLQVERATRAADAWRAWEKARAELDKLRARQTRLRAELRDTPSAQRRKALRVAAGEARQAAVEVEALVATVVRRSRLALSPDRPEVQARLLRVLQARLMRAERAGAQDTARWYRRLLEQFDPDGSVARWLRHGAPLEVRTSPAGLMARVLVESAHHDTRRVDTLLRGPTPVSLPDVPPGSGVVRIGDGRADIHIPFRIRRDRALSIEIPWPETIRPGFTVITAGRFLYGGDPLDDDGAGPRSARLPTYRIAQSPVTWQAWRAFLAALAEHDPAQAALRTPRLWINGPPLDGPEGCRVFGTPTPDRPVTGITLADAHAYCAWRSAADGVTYRLPTSAEWEKAARGVDGRRWPWGDVVAPEESTPPLGLHAVGAVEIDSSPYGVRDIASGVFEWTITAARRAEGLCYLRGDCSALPMQGAACVRRLTWDPVRPSPFVGFRMVMP